MYNNPNQPQQAPYGQSPYGPPPQYPVPPVPAPAQQPKKGRRWLWIILGIIGVLVLACVGGFFVVINTVLHNPATDVVNHYYTAIASQNYGTAYQYLDPSIKLTTSQGTGQQITQALFTQAGQGLDTAKGKVTSYKITSTLLSTNNGGNFASFTVSVTRNGAPYDIHLMLHQEGSTWKIISFDNV
jgi:hypothetical protein